MTKLEIELAVYEKALRIASSNYDLAYGVSDGIVSTEDAMEQHLKAARVILETAIKKWKEEQDPTIPADRYERIKWRLKEFGPDSNVQVGTSHEDACFLVAEIEIYKRALELVEESNGDNMPEYWLEKAKQSLA